jgi:hypothetical protein
MEKRGGPTLPLLEPTPDQASRLSTLQPTVPRGTTSSLEELELCIRKWRTQTPCEINNQAKLRSHIINKAEFDHREWGVRGSVG